MNILKRFGVGSSVYTFPTDKQFNYQCDFGNLKSYMAGLPGIHGGFSGLGSGRGKAAVGTVECDVLLEFNSPTEATNKIDSLRQMQDWGLMPLWMQPTVGAERHCWARLMDAPLDQDAHDVPHARQRMSLKFEVPDPFWYTAGVERLWDDGSNWDTGNWDGSASAPAAVSITTSGDVTVTGVAGTMYTLARLLVIKDTAGVASNPIIRRMVNGAVADEVAWIGDLNNGEFLEINARAQTVIKVGTHVYSTFQKPRNPDWMRLYPGTNTLRVNLSGTAKVAARWLERTI